MRPISKELSVYLNIARWCAAAAVVLYHLRVTGFGSVRVNSLLPSHGQACVMIFFVISGFVIAYTIDMRRSNGPLDFFVDRAVRIYSVAIPVLILCTILALVRPDLFPGHSAILRPTFSFFANATFLSEAWYFDFTPYLDEPYRSLCYEVAYYLIFGIWSFARGWSRWLLLLVAVVIAGPKILILLPAWLMGVAVYKLINRVKISEKVGHALTIGAPAALLVAIAVGLGKVADNASAAIVGPEFTWSKDFLRNWMVAAGFAVHLYGVSQISLYVVLLVKELARKLADMSYSLYLLHMPLLLSIGHYFGKGSNFSLLVLILTIFPLCYAFSLVTEGQRQRIKDWIYRPGGGHL